MKVLRRSIKGEKADPADPAPRHISITPKSAIAIMPPKKVIKALYDYQPEPGHVQELAFHKGDFFHVISQEDDPYWYEACNPLIPNARGLVPVRFFEVIGKTERQSAGSTASSASTTLPRSTTLPLHDSGYSEQSGHGRQDSNATARKAGHTRQPSTGRGLGAMVYGVVQYDFSAERPDELEAKKGEPIIVIAQSNPEWFVAKPIERLGGPGLIPVSFIEIRDMTTGKVVPDAQEAVQRAGVPKVEEWKKIALDYKNSSIALGKIESGNQATLQRAMERISLSNGNQQVVNGHSYSHDQDYNQRNGSRTNQQYQTEYNRQSSVPLLAPISASIPRYCFADDKYCYIIECVLEDGRHWKLSRFYQNFYDFQIKLLQEFPREAGQEGVPRTLPFMPGPVTYVTNAISNGRRESLNKYVKDLLALPAHISRCQLVRRLFQPREGDFEMDPNAVAEDFRLSSTSQHSYGANNDSPTASRQSSQGQMSNSNGAYPHGAVAPPGPQQRSTHQRNPSSSTSPQTNGNGQLPYQQQSPINRQPSSLTQTSNNTSNPSITAVGANASSTNVASAVPASGAMKIKVFVDQDAYAIRVPSDISYQQLKDKLRDRFKIGQGERGEDFLLQYKDEPSGGLVELAGERDLDVALRRNPKLTLVVRGA